MQLLLVTSPADPLVKEKVPGFRLPFDWLGARRRFFGRPAMCWAGAALSPDDFHLRHVHGVFLFGADPRQLLIFRFVAALGIGGEWAVGSLAPETWPKRWRPWIAAVLQTGVNIGVLLACATVYLAAYFNPHYNPRYVFWWAFFRRCWFSDSPLGPGAGRMACGQRAKDNAPSVAELFRGLPVRRTTLLTIVVCATSLSAWWAFMLACSTCATCLKSNPGPSLRKKTGQPGFLPLDPCFSWGQLLCRMAGPLL